MTSAEDKPALVLLAGDLAEFQIDRSRWHVIIAADGGAAHALARGVLPDLVIGDLDSLPPDHVHHLQAAGVPIKRYPVAKDFTDGEACIQKAIALGANPIVIAGGLGGRFDHMLGNVLLLRQIYDAGRQGWVTDGRQRVYWLQDHLSLVGHPGDQLSIIPLTQTVRGVTLTGTRWPLAGNTLTFASTRSISNELATSRITVTVEAGRALVVLTPAEHIT